MYPIVSDDMVRARHARIAEGYRKSRGGARGPSRGSRQRSQLLELVVRAIPGRIRPQAADRVARETAPHPSY